MHTDRTSTARLRLNVWVIAALVTVASPLAMQSEMHTAARANSYDDGWQENWVAHARAVLAGTEKSNGFVLQVGDSMTHTMAVSSWPRGPAGATPEDLATLNWSRSSSWSTNQVDVTQKNGWYLAGADTTGWRGMTAAGGLSLEEMVFGCCNGTPAMPAVTTTVEAQGIISDSTYVGNLQIDTMIAAFRDAQFAVVMLGSNVPGDSQNIAHLTTIIDKLEAQHIVPILSTIPPRNDGISNDLNVQLNSSITQLAQSRNLPLIDYYQEILLRRPGTTWMGTLVSTDGLHPTASGGGFTADSNPYIPGGDPAIHKTGDALLNVGYLLRSWLIVQKLKEVKQHVIDAGTPGNGTASFLGADVASQGTWRGVYGQDGYWLAQDAINLPGYAQVTLSEQFNWVWAASTSDLRALQKPGGSDRVAATWYSPASFTLDIDLTDGGAHDVGLYCVDWDANTRSQQVEVFDANSNALLDARALSNFSNGQYVRWRLSGHVRIRVTNLSSPNAVVSGLFFDSAVAPSNTLPVVSLTSPAAGTTYTAPASIAFAASASDNDGSINRVEFYANGALVGTDTTSPYEVTWSDVTAGGYSLSAKAVDEEGATTISSPVSVTVSSPPPQSTLHIGDLDSGAQILGRQQWMAMATVTVHTGAHTPLAGATVSGQWSGGYSGASTCTTNAAGECKLSTGNINVKKPSATLTITAVTDGTSAYRSADNHDPEGGTGSTITVVRR